MEIMNGDSFSGNRPFADLWMLSGLVNVTSRIHGTYLGHDNFQFLQYSYKGLACVLGLQIILKKYVNKY